MIKLTPELKRFLGVYKDKAEVNVIKETKALLLLSYGQTKFFIRKKDMVDKNVEAVKLLFSERAEKGYEKYGVTTERTDIDLKGWLQHLQEELMDAVIYIERIKGDIDDAH